jgi:hypothetical protein
MLIRALYEHAKANGLGLSPFEKKTLAHRLVLGPKGFVRFESADREVAVPIESRSASTPKPYSLHDTAEYVLGVGKATERAHDRCEAFWERTREILVEVGDKVALLAVDAAIADKSWLKKLPKGKIEGWVGLALDGEERFIVERDPLVDHEKARFAAQSAAGGPHFCAVTGESCTAVRLHDKIKGINGTGGGTALIAFNQQTATDGLSQGLNFTLSPRVMKGYTAALNQLLRTNRASFGETTCGVFWGPKDADAIARVVDLYTKNDVRAAAWDRVRSMQDCDELLHLIFFKGSRSRAAVLNYDVVPTKVVVAELLRYYGDFSEALAERDRILKRNEPSPMPSLAGNIQNAAPGTELEFADLDVAVSVRNVLLGRKLPRRVIYGLLRTLQPADVVKNKLHALWAMRWLEHQGDVQTGPRKGVMKNEPHVEPKIEDFVIEDNSIDTYQLGRLVALGVSLRYIALGRALTNDGALASLTRAMQCPAAFARASTRDFVVHSPKARGSLIVQLSMDVWTRIKTDLLSRTTPLTLAEVGSLHQGYMHQMAYNRAIAAHKRAMREAKKDTADDAQAAAE